MLMQIKWHKVYLIEFGRILQLLVSVRCPTLSSQNALQGRNVKDNA